MYGVCVEAFEASTSVYLIYRPEDGHENRVGGGGGVRVSVNSSAL